MSSSSTNGLTKAKAQSKASINIAALAARNLGGFVPNKIFVGGVPIQALEDQFKAYFERFGAISKVELHALRGFGYITYEQVDSVDSCLDKYEEHYLCKKWVEVKRSIPRELIDSYEREQKRLEAEFKKESGDLGPELEAPSVKVETPQHGASAAPTWGMPAAAWGSPSGGLPPGPGIRRATPKASAASEEPGGTAMNSQIQNLMEMGFTEATARRVYRECAWDFNKALDRLLSGDFPQEEPEPAAEEVASPPPAEDPPLPAATATTAAPAAAAAVAEPDGAASPARAKEAPAWGKAAPQTSWAKAPETVWGMPKPAAAPGSAWGKQASPPASAKLPAASPKLVSSPKVSPTAAAKVPSPASPKVGSTPKASPGTPTAKSPKAAPASIESGPPPAPAKAKAEAVAAAGYNTAAAAPAPAKAEGAGDASAQPVDKAPTPHATPPTKPTAASAASPAAALLPAAAGAGAVVSPGPSSTSNLKAEEEPQSVSSVPATSQLASEVNSSPAGKVSEERLLPSTHKSDISLGATEAAAASQEEPIAVAAAANVLDAEDDEGKAADAGQNNAELPRGPSPGLADSKGSVEAGSVSASAVEGDRAPPRKRTQRMKREWVAEDPSQMSAAEGDFVMIWVDTGTDHGWIHAEKVTAKEESSQVGWLPICVLNPLPEFRKWMRTKQAWQAMGESQCNVEEGVQVVVWVDSRTDQGWTYVEGSEEFNVSPGWLPDFALEWNDD